MSTFQATITSREQWDDLLTNWPFGWLVKPQHLTFAAFINECEFACMECALNVLERGEAEDGKIEVFSFDSPLSRGEPCCECDEYIVEPHCDECGMSEDEMERYDPTNTLRYHASGETALCRRCYLTHWVRGTLDAYDRGAYEPARGWSHVLA